MFRASTQAVKDDKFLQDPHLVARQLLDANDDSENNTDNGAIARCIILGRYCCIFTDTTHITYMWFLGVAHN